MPKAFSGKEDVMDRNELFEWVKDRFGTQPEYLWVKFPNFAVFRNKKQKWYAAVMDISKRKLGLEEDEIIDILNVKCDPLLVGSLRLKEGYFPAYHMNKDKWISVSLDSAVDDEEIKALVELSFDLTNENKK